MKYYSFKDAGLMPTGDAAAANLATAQEKKMENKLTAATALEVLEALAAVREEAAWAAKRAAAGGK